VIESLPQDRTLDLVLLDFVLPNLSIEKIPRQTSEASIARRAINMVAMKLAVMMKPMSHGDRRLTDEGLRQLLLQEV